MTRGPLTISVMGRYMGLPAGYDMCPGCSAAAVRRGGRPLCPDCDAAGVDMVARSTAEATGRTHRPPRGETVRGGRVRDELLDTLRDPRQMRSQQPRSLPVASQRPPADAPASGPGPTRVDRPSGSAAADTSRSSAAQDGRSTEAAEETRVLRFTVPGEPVPKERARTVHTPVADPTAPDGMRMRTRTFTPERTKTYSDIVGFAAGAASKGRPLKGYLRITITVFSRRDVWDTDNVTKSIKDGAQGETLAMANDRQVRSERFDQKFRFDGEPRVEVQLEPYDPWTGTAYTDHTPT